MAAHEGVTPSIDSAGRLAAVRATIASGAASAPSLDEVLRLARRLCDSPAAAISIVDADRQSYTVRSGIETEEMPREHSFAVHGIAGGGIFEVQARPDSGVYGDAHGLQIGLRRL